MATSLSAILALLSPLLLLTSLSADNSDVIVPTKLAASNNEFSCEIYRQVSGAATPGTNVLLSPFSVLLGLGMVHAGARGRTRLQLTKAMHLDDYKDNETAIGEEFRRLTSIVKSPLNNYTLRTANRLFADKTGLRLRDDFLGFTERYFGAALMPVNFARAVDQSRSIINEWVSDNTENKINDALAEGSIDKDTVLVIVNAIFFKGLWANGFHKGSTKSQKFHVSRDHHVTVAMMTQPVAAFNYHESADLECQVLELMYAGNDASMYVFLPRDVDGLPAVESRLNAASLATAFRSMETARVKVTLPRFKEDQGVTLKQSLGQLGMTDLFDGADLSGIDGTRRLRVTEAVHRAYIAVDEEGTEAAASTAVAVKTKSVGGVAEQPFVVFTADRPFVYAIVNRASGCVLFLGRFAAPADDTGSEAEGDGGEVVGPAAAEKRLGEAAAGSNGAAAMFPGFGLLLVLVLLLPAALMRLKLL